MPNLYELLLEECHQRGVVVPPNASIGAIERALRSPREIERLLNAAEQLSITIPPYVEDNELLLSNSIAGVLCRRLTNDGYLVVGALGREFSANDPTTSFMVLLPATFTHVGLHLRKKLLVKPTAGGRRGTLWQLQTVAANIYADARRALFPQSGRRDES